MAGSVRGVEERAWVRDGERRSKRSSEQLPAVQSGKKSRENGRGRNLTSTRDAGPARSWRRSGDVAATRRRWGGRHSWRDPEEGALGLLVPVARQSGTWRCWETGRRGRSGTGYGELRWRSSCLVKQGRRLCAARREAESGERGEGGARAACYLRREREARGERDSTRGRRRSRRGCRAEVARGGRKEGRGRR